RASVSARVRGGARGSDQPPRRGRADHAVRLELLLRLVSLLVTAEEALGPLAGGVAGPGGVLVAAGSGPLVDLFLALGEGLVRLVAEPLFVHVYHLLHARLPQTAPPGNRNAVTGRD